MREAIFITTFEAYIKIQKVDEKFVGTEHYLGVYWFWNYDFRHVLRDATYSQRRRVHKGFLKAGLKVDGSTDAHLQIIKKYINIYKNKK